MLGVEWDPDSVEIEALGADVALADFGDEDPLSVGDGADVAFIVGRLALGQFVDDVIHAFAKPFIVGRGKHQGASAEIVPKAVPGNRIGFPASIVFCPREEAGLLAKVGQEPVRLIAEQSADIELHRATEGAIEQFHLIERERPGCHDNSLRCKAKLGESTRERACHGRKQPGNGQRWHRGSPIWRLVRWQRTSRSAFTLFPARVASKPKTRTKLLTLRTRQSIYR